MTKKALAGDHAEAPSDIPPRGWWQIARRGFAEAKADNVPMLAGGVAFFAFLALFPALIAALTIYGLVADPAQVTAQIEALARTLPASTQPLIAEQLTAITQGSSTALGVGLVISILAALWSASSGVGNLMAAINIAYDERESRGFFTLRGTALALTLGAICSCCSASDWSPWYRRSPRHSASASWGRCWRGCCASPCCSC